MDPRRLLIFREVARQGSLSKAAAKLGWTQPAVGQHIQRLERELGLPLVLRSARGITLTEAGATLLTHADALATRLSAAEAELEALATLRAGSLRLVAFPSAAAVLVPPVLAELAARAPALDIRLTEAEPPEARAQILSGDADVALVFTHHPTPDHAPTPDRRAGDGRPAADHRAGAGGDDLLTIDLFEDPLKVLLPPTHRLARRGRPVALDELAEERWIAGCPRCEANLITVTAAAGFTPDVRHRTDDYVVVQRLVAEGLAVTLLPQLSLTAAPNPAVTGLPVRTRPKRQVSVVLRTEMHTNPAVSATLDALTAVPR